MAGRQVARSGGRAAGAGRRAAAVCGGSGRAGNIAIVIFSLIEECLYIKIVMRDLGRMLRGLLELSANSGLSCFVAKCWYSLYRTDLAIAMTARACHSTSRALEMGARFRTSVARVSIWHLKI